MHFYSLFLSFFLFCYLEGQRKLSILAKMPWSTEETMEIQIAIGSMEYTSSDESDLSEDEDGNVIVSAYLVKKLPWERCTLTNVKKT